MRVVEPQKGPAAPSSVLLPCRGSLLDCQHYAPLNLARLEPGEHVVNALQRLGCGRRFDFALCRERDRLSEVAAGAHNGAADRDSLEHHVKDRGRELARW